MKLALLHIALLFFGIRIQAQCFHPEDYHPSVNHETGIGVKSVYSDSLSLSFVITVAQSVNPHIHKKHTEHVYIIGGKGEMLLGDSLFIISEGDIIAIPTNTVHAVRTLNNDTLKALSIQAPQFYNKDRYWVESPLWKAEQ